MPTYAADQNLNERTQDVDVVFAWVSVSVWQHLPAPCVQSLPLVDIWLAWIQEQPNLTAPCLVVIQTDDRRTEVQGVHCHLCCSCMYSTAGLQGPIRGQVCFMLSISVHGQGVRAAGLDSAADLGLCRWAPVEFHPAESGTAGSARA